MKPSAGGVILNGKSTTRRTGLELVKMRQETVSFIFQEEIFSQTLVQSIMSLKLYVIKI